MRKWQTYGVSNITLHTIAMVLNTSVVFSMGKFLFCWAKAKKYLFLSYFLKMSLTTDFKYVCLPPTQILLCHHLMSLAWVWHQHKIEISDWPAHYSPRFLPLPTWTDTKNIFNGVKIDFSFWTVSQNLSQSMNSSWKWLIEDHKENNAKMDKHWKVFSLCPNFSGEKKSV